MRILLIDVALRSLNPTAGLAPDLIARLGEASFFGPGYSTEDELSLGLLRYIERVGPFDWIFLGPFAPAFDFTESARDRWISYIRSFTVNQTSPYELRSFHADFSRSWPILSRSRIAAWLLNFDYYAATQMQVEWLEENGVYPITPSQEFSPSTVSVSPLLASEDHFQRKRERLTTVWRDYLSRNEARVLNSLHFVAETEFCYSSASTRRSDVSVPGVGYSMRKVARKALSGTDLVVDRNLDLKAIRSLDRIGFHPFRWPKFLDAYHAWYRHSLKQCSMAYVAPGGFGLPVRKYFEVPAAGCLLLVKPCLGFAEIGFVDGVNCIVAEPGNLREVAEKVAASQDLNTIAARGRNLIRTSHSTEARADQIRAMMNSVDSNRFVKSVWRTGKLEVVGR